MATAEEDEMAAAAGEANVAFPPAEHWPTGRLLSAAARRGERAWDAYLAQWGLTHASVPVLVVLVAGPLSQRQVAEQMHVTEQTIGRVVHNLERGGHVTRTPHITDRRRRVVAITGAGRRALEALDDPSAIEALIGSSLSPEQLDQLRALLVQLVTGLPLPERRDSV